VGGGYLYWVGGWLGKQRGLTLLIRRFRNLDQATEHVYCVRTKAAFGSRVRSQIRLLVIHASDWLGRVIYEVGLLATRSEEKPQPRGFINHVERLERLTQSGLPTVSTRPRTSNGRT
jgi:hypothetical protein